MLLNAIHVNVSHAEIEEHTYAGGILGGTYTCFWPPGMHLNTVLPLFRAKECPAECSAEQQVSICALLKQSDGLRYFATFISLSLW